MGTRYYGQNCVKGQALLSIKELQSLIEFIGRTTLLPKKLQVYIAHSCLGNHLNNGGKE